MFSSYVICYVYFQSVGFLNTARLAFLRELCFLTAYYLYQYSNSVVVFCSHYFIYNVIIFYNLQLLSWCISNALSPLPPPLPFPPPLSPPLFPSPLSASLFRLLKFCYLYVYLLSGLQNRNTLGISSFVNFVSDTIEFNFFECSVSVSVCDTLF